MAAVILDGDTLAAKWLDELKRDVAALAAEGIEPRLATILVGENDASNSYILRKHADCAQIGIASDDIRLPADVSERALLDRVRRFNDDKTVDGLIVQLPLPKHMDTTSVQMALKPAKDVDGLHPVNLGALINGAPGLRPCTPSAIIGLLRAYGVPLAGRHVAIIGRGLLVGRPLALMLAHAEVNAIPTLLHRGAPDIGAITRESDIVIAAAGAAEIVRADMVRPGAAVVGVGITYRDGTMVSDIADDVAKVASFVTPHHGSVGPLTRASLLRNVVAAARAAR